MEGNKMNEENLPTTYEDPALIDVDSALKEWEVYQDLTNKLLNDSDYQPIGGSKFKKKSAWRKYMRAFRLSDTVLEKEIIKDEEGRVNEASFLVKVWSPDGRSAEGWGNCSIFENRRFSKVNHDIPSTAMTRAINRAVSDLIGAGEVSAEEMEGTKNTKPRPKPKPKPKRKPSPPKQSEPEGVQDAELSKTYPPELFKDTNKGELVIELLKYEKKPLTRKNINARAVKLMPERLTMDDVKEITSVMDESDKE